MANKAVKIVVLAVSVIAVECLIHLKSRITYELHKFSRKVLRPSKRRKLDGQLLSEIEAFKCPISHKVMKNPVMTPYGHCFDKPSISKWLRQNRFCPLTRQSLTESQLTPCHSLKHAIKQLNEIVVL